MVADVQDRPSVSERKRAANRANAARSTGPRTEEGKARSRMNALTHGLRAEQVVLPHEDAGAFEAERAAFFDEWRPTTATRAVLVDRLAADAWRLRRCVRVEASRMRAIAEEAGRAFDDEARARLDKALDGLEDDPAWAVGELMRDRPGVDMLRSCWERLASVLSIEGEWKDPERHHDTFCRLLGLDPTASPAGLGDEVMVSWTLMVTNSPSLARDLPWDDPDGELARPFPAARAEKIRGLLLGLAEHEAGRLADHRGRLPDPKTLRDRQIDEHCVDASPEGAALQRYEAMHDRSFRANLGQLIKLSETGADLVEAETHGAPIEARPVVESLELARTLPREPEAPNEATEEAIPAAPARTGPTARRPRRAPGRDRGGRSWPSAGPDGVADGP